MEVNEKKRLLSYQIKEIYQYPKNMQKINVKVNRKFKRVEYNTNESIHPL